ncbi:hypothetical protein ACROYT_G019338 [Oculina patagonica]
MRIDEKSDQPTNRTPTQLVAQLATHDDSRASVEGTTPEKPPKVNLRTEVRELKAELAAIWEEEDLLVVFEPKEEEAWPEGLEVKGCLHRIPSRFSSQMYVPVCNNIEREMTLRRRTELATIQFVHSVTLLPVEAEQKREEEEGETWSEATSYEWEPSQPNKVKHSGLPQLT